MPPSYRDCPSQDAERDGFSRPVGYSVGNDAVIWVERRPPERHSLSRLDSMCHFPERVARRDQILKSPCAHDSTIPHLHDHVAVLQG